MPHCERNLTISFFWEWNEIKKIVMVGLVAVVLIGMPMQIIII